MPGNRSGPAVTTDPLLNPDPGQGIQDQGTGEDQDHATVVAVPVAVDPTLADPYLFAQPIYLAAGWRGVMPVPLGEKYPVGIKGLTGKSGGWPSDEDLIAWAEYRPDHGVYLRLPEIVLGIDVDAHSGKSGALSLAAIEAKHGALRPTWITTSRGDGVSGIRLYRAKLPEGRRWKEKKAGDNIELLHFGHRGAMVWPSRHPDTGAMYHWTDPNGVDPVDTVPRVSDLAELDQAVILDLSEPIGKKPPKPPVQERLKGRLVLAPKRTPYSHEQANTNVEQALEKLRAAPNGGRNNQLNDSAMEVGHYVPGLLTEEQAIAQLSNLAEEIGLDDDEIGPTITSGLGAGMAEPYDVEEEDRQEPSSEPGRAASSSSTPRQSRRVNLRPYLDGTYVAPVPSVGGQRADGVRMLYPGRWHTVIALTAAGKSWLAIWHAYVELMAGKTVVYLHFEEASPALTLGRLRALGLDDDVIAERFIWLDCDAPWTVDTFGAEIKDLDEVPTLVTLDGINAAVAQHGWAVNEPRAVAEYRAVFVRPMAELDAAILSLGHPPKAPDRQAERHGFGSTAWLDEVDGVGFRMIATGQPIRRGKRGASGLYVVKDRDDQVQRHGVPVRNRDGWSYMGAFVLDNSTTLLGPDGAHKATSIELLAPPKDQDQDQIGHLAEAITAWLEKRGEFSSQRRLIDGLRAAKVAFNDRDIGPALSRLEEDGRLERIASKSKGQGGRLIPESGHSGQGEEK
jgi:hypothetical protein